MSSMAHSTSVGRLTVSISRGKLTPAGYEIRVLEAWGGFPTGDLVADTALMNERLQGYIDEMPAQYYWVHKRFKTRPPGEAGVY